MAPGKADPAGPIDAGGTEWYDVGDVLFDLFGEWLFEERFQEFFCPLTMAPLVDPVLAEDGATYSREAFPP
eukprot:16445928-Heterocapsa_arctica.AAC.1